MKGLLVEEVMKGSVADELGIEPGDRLIAIDGHRLRDIIDFHYWASGDQLVLDLERADGSLWECEVEDAMEQPLGLRFATPSPARCRNACIFCFVHQLPRGLRRPLYVKDEDYRLSFLYGNYVTLANVRRSELVRIKKQRLSPLYISVHATDPALRDCLLGRSGAPPILDIIQELAAARIVMHTQVVLCPGLNDGAALEQTVRDLAELHPQVASLAIVPVGLTSHRTNLPLLTPVTAAYAAAFIREWQPQAERLEQELGEPFLFLADEFYLKAGLPFPDFSSYGEFPQLENGVGMVPLFRDEAAKVLRKARRLGNGSATVVTGVSALPVISEFLSALSDRTGVTLTPCAVENRLFGPSVTVTGLISGGDIIASLQGRDVGDLLLIPDVMLKEGEGIFLDDLTVADLQKETSARICIVDTSPSGLYEAIRKRFRPRR